MSGRLAHLQTELFWPSAAQNSHCPTARWQIVAGGTQMVSQ